MGRIKRGRAVRNARQKTPQHYESEDVKRAPHVLVFKRGNAGSNVKELIKDVRKVMEPFTAPNLKASKKKYFKRFYCHFKSFSCHTFNDIFKN